jgi:hypothetical protein
MSAFEFLESEGLGKIATLGNDAAVPFGEQYWASTSRLNNLKVFVKTNEPANEADALRFANQLLNLRDPTSGRKCSIGIIEYRHAFGLE